MFKIKGQKKPRLLNLNSEITIWNSLERTWENYVVREIRFSTSEGKLDNEYWGTPLFSKQMDNIFLCRESRIPEHMEQNLLIILKR